MNSPTFIPTVLPGDPVSVAPVAAPIDGDGWFPAIDPAQFRGEMRVDAKAITDDRVRHVLIAAMLNVGSDLELWRLTRLAEGSASLEAVQAARIEGKSVLLWLYRRAVFARAKAELVERYADVDLTGRGERAADQMDPTAAELRRDSLHAVRDILGVGHTAIELI